MPDTSELAVDHALLLEAQKRLSETSGKILSLTEVMQECGITEKQLEQAAEPDIE